MQLNSICVNPAMLRTNTWADLAAMTTNWTQWLAPDAEAQSTNPLILAFVQQSLPSNYRAVLTPYDAARTLHRAVARQIVYQTPVPHIDALFALTNGYSDCGGYANLMVSCLRSIGIPARLISGFWEGTNDVHCNVEFHLPNVGWLLANPTRSSIVDQTGTYAYYFGYVLDANSYLAVDVGEQHILSYGNFSLIEVPTYFGGGIPTNNSYTYCTYLQPDGVLALTNLTKNTVQLVVTDVPAEGSVILQSSTNLVTWTPVATNSAASTNLSYLFPASSQGRQFYRAMVAP